MVLETYKNCDELHPKTVFLYLHDDHYYMIMNLTGFLGSPYVCQFCYKSYTTLRDHRCKQACNVCFDAECHRFPKRTIHCPIVCVIVNRAIASKCIKEPPSRSRIPLL